MKLFNLALSYMKGSKSAIIPLFIMIFVASLLLNLGMTILVKMNSFYDEKLGALREPHISLMLKSEDEQEAFYDYIKENNQVFASEREEIILLNFALFRYGESEMSMSITIQQLNQERDFSPVKLIEEQVASDNEKGIYLPYSFKVSGGYQLGDPFSFTYMEQTYQYTILGFFESALMGTSSSGMMKFILPEQGYNHLVNETNTNGVLYSIELNERGETEQFLNDFHTTFPDPNLNAFSPLFIEIDSNIVESVGLMTVNIIVMILIAFAIVIVAVTLIVIQFRVSNHITEGIQNIGVLKALGYSSYQIMLSILLQFMLIAGSASLVGVMLSYPMMPVFGGVVSSLSGLLWNSGFFPTINIISICFVMLLVIIVTFVSTLRVLRLHPVVALRGGIVTHNFKKNRFPLDKRNGGLQFLLACKTMFTNMKQNAMIVVIISSITFATIFSFILYYNIAKEKTAFLHLVGSETSNVMVQVTPDFDDREQLFVSLGAMDHVTKVAVFDMLTIKIDGNEKDFYMNISDDYSKMNNQLVYEGRFPRYDNEIAISWVVADLLDKNIGDQVEVMIGEHKQKYIVTGLSQSISNLGLMSYLTVDGMKQLTDDYKWINVNIYLDGEDNASFISKLKTVYPDQFTDIIDVTETIKSQSSIYISAVYTVMVTVMCITVLIVMLILYLVIKKLIVQRKRELGILKAIGYTNLQLISQISLSFLPIVIFSVLIGGVLGVLYTNSLLTVLLSSAGVRSVQFIVNIPFIVVICIALVLLSYCISLLVANGIRKITTYQLMTE